MLTLGNKAHEGDKRQEEVSCVNTLNYTKRMERDFIRSSQLLENKGVGQSAKLSVAKSVAVDDELENKQLSDVISTWSSLPPHIREVILLLVRQHVQ